MINIISKEKSVEKKIEIKDNKKNIAKLEKENYRFKQTIEDLNYQIN